MNPVFLRLGHVTIYWYGICMALAFLAGLGTWIWVGRKNGRDVQFCSDLLFWVMVAGILGGRIAYIISNASYYLQDPVHIFYLWEGGLIYYGGFIGAIIAVWVFARRRGITFLGLLDFAMTALPLSHAIGRVGCFINGCCFGAVCGRWPGVTYPALSLPWSRQVELGLIGQDAARTLPIHPVQLYESLLNLALYPVLLMVYRRRRHDGEVVALYLITYPVGRFLLEYLRGTERVYWGALSAAQSISLGLVALGLIVLLYTRRRGAAPAVA